MTLQVDKSKHDKAEKQNPVQFVFQNVYKFLWAAPLGLLPGIQQGQGFSSANLTATPKGGQSGHGSSFLDSYLKETSLKQT